MEQRVECRCQILAKGIITIFFSQKYVIWKKFCTQLTCVGMGGGGGCTSYQEPVLPPPGPNSEMPF